MDKALVPEYVKLALAIFSLAWGMYRIFTAPKPLAAKVTVQVIVGFVFAVVLLAFTHFERLWHG